MVVNTIPASGAGRLNVSSSHPALSRQERAIAAAKAVDSQQQKQNPKRRGKGRKGASAKKPAAEKTPTQQVPVKASPDAEACLKQQVAAFYSANGYSVPELVDEFDLSSQRAIGILSSQGLAVNPMVDRVIALYAEDYSIFSVQLLIKEEGWTLSLASIICILFLTRRWDPIGAEAFEAEWMAYSEACINEDGSRFKGACPPYPKFSRKSLEKVQFSRFGAYPVSNSRAKDLASNVNRALFDSASDDLFLVLLLQLDVHLTLSEIERRCQ